MRPPRALPLLAAWVLFAARVATAHPFGSGSVNRYLGVELASDRRAHLAYLLDFGELPAAHQFERLDRDGDGAITPAERDAYLDTFLPPIIARWQVQIDGAPVALHVEARTLEAPPGENGLPTLRIIAELLSDPAPAPRDPSAQATVHVHDDAFAERDGWREIRADDSDAGALTASDAPNTGLRGETRTMRVDDATFTFRVAGAPQRARSVVAPRTRARSTRGYYVAVALSAALVVAGVIAARLRRRTRASRRQG